MGKGKAAAANKPGGVVVGVVAAVSKAVAEEPKAEGTEGHGANILVHDIDTIAVTNRATLKHCKTSMHEEHKHTSDQKPAIVRKACVRIKTTEDITDIFNIGLQVTGGLQRHGCFYVIKTL